MEIRLYDDLVKVVEDYKAAPCVQRPMMICFGPEEPGESNHNLDVFKKHLRKYPSVQFDANQVTEPAGEVDMIVMHNYLNQMNPVTLNSCVAAVGDYGKPVLCLVNSYDYKPEQVSGFDVVYYCAGESQVPDAQVDEGVEVEGWLVGSLQKAFDEGLYRIHFRPNPKYDADPLGVYYIGFADIFDYKYNIRKKVGDEYCDDTDPIIAKYYGGIKNILADGWRAD